MKKHSSIVLNLFLLLTVVLLSSCATVTNKKSCYVNRAAFDIGSGSTKMVVARVNTCTSEIVNVLLEAQRPIGFKQALINSKDNKLGKVIINKAISTLLELKFRAQSLGATQFSAMATSAFRTAANGKSAAEKISKGSGVKLKAIDQTMEARLGYLGALSKINKSSRPFIVWDIGGGSMQITQREKGGVWKYYLGKVASVSFKDKVLKKFYKKAATTPNPLRKRRALQSIELSREYAKKVPSYFKDLSQYDVYGIGGVHYYSIRKQTKVKKKEYNQKVVYNTLLKRSKLNDAEIGGQYAQTDVTNLALVLGHMQSLKIPTVKTLKVNMAHGLLLDQESWQ